MKNIIFEERSTNDGTLNENEEDIEERIRIQKELEIPLNILQKESNITESLQNNAEKLQILIINNKIEEEIEETNELYSSKLEIKLPIPLKNVSDNCYMNASFQGLLPAFLELMRMVGAEELPEQCSAFWLMKEFVYYYNNQIKFSIPEFIHNHSNLNYFGQELSWNNQEDAHEFLNCFLNRLNEELKLYFTLPSLFEIAHDSRYFCDFCGKSNTSDPRIVKDQTILVNFGNDMNQMIREYLKCKVDGYNCENCLIKNGSASGSTIFSEVPNFLVICTKRFIINDEGIITKILDMVDIEEYIELKYTNNEVEDVAKYSLESVVNHCGDIDQGHYYTYVKHDNQWYETEDENISLMDFNRVKNDGASTNYLQMYRKL